MLVAREGKERVLSGLLGVKRSERGCRGRAYPDLSIEDLVLEQTMIGQDTDLRSDGGDREQGQPPAAGRP